MIPALLKMTSRPPQASVFFTISSTWASFETSQTCPHESKQANETIMEETYKTLDYGIRSELLDLGHSFVKLLGVDIAHQHIGTVLCEQDGGLQSDSSRGAGDDAVLAFETAHVCCVVFVLGDLLGEREMA
jgi:hypothetical protein